jgi:site-specific DNA-methyltransferase (adenine-specific)
MEEWNGRVFCNPPYSNIRDFLEKGRNEIEAGRAEVVVYLLPARTGTRWFHDLILHRGEIRFLRGRLRFGDASNVAPFDSMVVVFRATRPAPEAGR